VTAKTATHATAVSPKTACALNDSAASPAASGPNSTVAAHTPLSIPITTPSPASLRSAPRAARG